MVCQRLQKGLMLMINKRPVFTTTIGNTIIKIRSALPFMTDEQQRQWFEENDSLPEVQAMKRVWIDMILDIEEKKWINNEMMKSNV